MKYYKCVYLVNSFDDLCFLFFTPHLERIGDAHGQNLNCQFNSLSFRIMAIQVTRSDLVQLSYFVRRTVLRNQAPKIFLGDGDDGPILIRECETVVKDVVAQKLEITLNINVYR